MLYFFVVLCSTSSKISYQSELVDETLALIGWVGLCLRLSAINKRIE